MEKDQYEELVEAVYRHELFGQTTDVKLSFAQYRNNGTLALQLHSRPDEDEMEFADAETPYCVPYATVTVNLPDSACLPVNVQFVDENNLPGIGAWLENAGLATAVDYFAQSGFCTYRAYEFHIPERIAAQTRECREDCIAANIIDAIESSGLKPDEKNDRGELYHLHLTGHPDFEVIIYKGTDPEHLGRKNDVFLLATHREKGEQMWRFRNLPTEVRGQVAESIRNAVVNVSRLKR